MKIEEKCQKQIQVSLGHATKMYSYPQMMRHHTRRNMYRHLRYLRNAEKEPNSHYDMKLCACMHSYIRTHTHSRPHAHTRTHMQAITLRHTHMQTITHSNHNANIPHKGAMCRFNMSQPVQIHKLTQRIKINCGSKDTIVYHTTGWVEENPFHRNLRQLSLYRSMK